MKNFRLVHTFFKCGLRFLIFGQEVPQKLKKLTQKRAPKEGACFHALCVHVRTCTHTSIINHLWRPQGSYPESFVKFRVDLAEKRDGQIVTKT